MIETFLAVVGVLFAFETPRRKFLSIFGGEHQSAQDCSMPSSAALSEHDRDLAISFRSLFAESGIFRLYQGHDFMLPLAQEAIRPLYTVVETWTDEAHYFVHPELRSKQQTFIKAVNELSEQIVLFTVPDGNGNVSVITRNMDPENLPEHVRAEAKAIDAKLQPFLQSHEQLLAKCNELFLIGSR